MVSIALISRKGGCGKTTLATHIAAYLARQGLAVTLGDLDHQASAQLWLKQRPLSAPAITGWSGNLQGALRVPPFSQYVVLDAPGGISGFALAKVTMIADFILIPVAGSIYDRQAAADCAQELRKLPRVANGRCQIAAIGMRLDRNSDEAQITASWAQTQGLTWLGWIRRAPFYVRAAENGLSAFDLPRAMTALDSQQWHPLQRWLRENGFAKPMPSASEPTAGPACTKPLEPEASLAPASQPNSEQAESPAGRHLISGLVPRFLLRG